MIVQLPCPPEYMYYPNATCFMPNVTWIINTDGAPITAADVMRLEVIQVGELAMLCIPIPMAGIQKSASGCRA